MTDVTCRLLDRYDGLLLDLDGVIYTGPLPVPHAVESVVAARSDGVRVGYVTNNASREPATVADQISSLGIPCRPEDVVSSAQAAAHLLIDELPAGAAVLVVGGRGLHASVAEAGFRIVSTAQESPAAVVQGFGPDVSWRELAEAGWAIAAGARHVATNLDLSIPLERGTAPGNGTLVAAVTAVTGAEPLVAGKPQATIFRYAADRLGSRRPLVAGDRLDTDLRGARAAGYAGLFVLTGVHTARDAVLAAPRDRPEHLGMDLRALHLPQREPCADGDEWTCGASRAAVHDGRLHLDGRPLTGDVTIDIDAWRALAAAAWAAADSGAALDADAVPSLTVVGDEAR